MQEIETENGIVAELAARVAAVEQAVQVSETGVPFVIDRNGSVKDLHHERFLAAPAGRSHSFSVTDVDSLVAIVLATGDGSEPMAECNKRTLSVGVHMDLDTMAKRSWGKWFHMLNLMHTPEWLAWMEADGKTMPQRVFAEFIEDQLDTIHDPSPANMMDIVTTMMAKTNVDFSSRVSLHDSTIGFQFEERTEAKAKGNLEVPREFTIALRPFEGAKHYQVRARLRFRAGSDGLKLGYKLIRPERVIDTAFGEICDEVVKRLGCGRINV